MLLCWWEDDEGRSMIVYPYKSACLLQAAYVSICIIFSTKYGNTMFLHELAAISVAALLCIL